MTYTVQTLGPEVRINTTTAGDQSQAAVAALAGGGYVVTWTSLNQDGSATGVYAQRYDANGIALGGEVRINTTTFNGQFQPVVAALADGGYVVTWTSSHLYGSSEYDVYAQRYDASGVALDGEVQINTTTAGSQYQQAVAGLADGGYIVTWISYMQDGSEWGEYAQRYDANGIALGGEVQINTSTAGSQYDPAVAALADGGYVVTWTSYNQHRYDVYAQRYDANGIAVGGEVRIGTTGAISDQPAVAALPDGGYVIVWRSWQDGSENVYAQRYDANGIALGDEVRVNTTTANNQSDPAVTALAGGGYVVTWTSFNQDGWANGVYAQCYDANGVAVGGEVRVNTTTAWNQYDPAVAALAGGGFVVTWTSSDQDGSESGVYSKTMTLTDNDNAPIVVNPLADQSTPEGSAFSLTLPPDTFADADGDELTLTATLVNGDPLPAWLTFNPDTRTFSGTPPIGAAGTVAIAVLASDGFHTSASDIFDLVITATNTPPVITSNGGDAAAAISQAENTAVVTTVGATDADGHTPTFSIMGGADAALFTISATTGALSFIAASDFENPADANHDNAYEVIVAADDGHGGSDTQTIAVTVTNVAGSTLTGNNSANTLTGGGEEDTLNGQGGNDTLRGGGGNDTLIGGTGTDLLDGGTGRDGMQGGDGNDTYVVDNELDAVTETGNGTDLVQITLSSYTLGPNVENLTFTGSGNFTGAGNGLANTITGGSGNDLLDGLGGADRMVGRDGDDTYVVDNANDSVVENSNAGTDTVRTTRGSYTLGNNVENLIYTGSGNFTGTGNGSANTIAGGSGADTLNGLGGNDTLIGGAGNDVMNGGNGYDDFVFDLGFGNDTINGFDANPAGGQDLLDLRGLGISSANFAGRVAIADLGADMRITVDGTDTITLSGVSGSGNNTITQLDFLL